MGLLLEGQDGIRALRMAVQLPQQPRTRQDRTGRDGRPDSDPNHNADDEATAVAVVPLFRLEVGVASSSAGLICARMAGVKPAVIDRGYEIVKALRQRRRVQPLTEIIRCQLPFLQQTSSSLSSSQQQQQPQPPEGAVQHVLAEFMGKPDWSILTDDEVHEFLSRVSEINSEHLE